MIRKPRLFAAGAALALVTVSACAGYGGPYRHYGPPPAGVVYVNTAPPARRNVIIPPRPTSLSVWIGGYWNWTGRDYAWIDGHWDDSPPHAGARWVPDQWVKTRQGWYRQPGRWK